MDTARNSTTDEYKIPVFRMDTSHNSTADEHKIPVFRMKGRKLDSETHIKSPLSTSNVFYTEPQVIHCDPSDFRSVVQHLTGSSVEDADRKTAHLISDKYFAFTRAYTDMLNCTSYLTKEMLDIDTYKFGPTILSYLTKSKKSGNVSQECLDCLEYCNLFPKDYILDGDKIVQLAEGLIKEEPMEDIAAAYLKALSEHQICISLLREDYGMCKIWYKIKGFDIPEQILERSKIIPLRVITEDNCTKSDHVILQHLLTKDLQALGKYARMRLLLLLQNHNSTVDSIPYDFFLSLKNLRTLDLSKTRVSELPSSIGSVKSLRYLDLSEALIKKLPETVEFLENLQTLKLQNCPRLYALPKSTRRLTRLRHLELGTLCRIRSMPVGMGALTCLRTLSELIAGSERGSSIGELKNTNNLGGKLCLSRVENVAILDDAREANLSEKRLLKHLELRWTDENIRQESIRVDHNVMECLQPHTNLQDLRIICFGGSTFPGWISHPSFVQLTKITLFKCANSLILPSLGQLPFLESLSLIELINVRIIDDHFRTEKLNADAAGDDGFQFTAFQALQKLEIKSMINLEKWIDVESQDFPCLEKLSIKNCPKLCALCELTNFGALEYLECSKCTKLPSLPQRKLPASLKTLIIDDCPSFRLSCFNEKQTLLEIQHSPILLIYQLQESR
ncbi:putative disease resistance protein RGA3 [Amaranthus tricolor]|uniref:putative disease resistance protein RGA3 n=1 Tax=Amaranthus tricolor TaxID=29722 RepID=UPI002590849F|nr:putative disease resistance protein RGA3 [Amaranthus tricolor]XP_057549968.1 putative disease resistance protein RGA3 [Amaranthus tricolor]XP_057549978.1 putative disease resistance protein RGA3 [Amaranthus tricolor]